MPLAGAAPARAATVASTLAGIPISRPAADVRSPVGDPPALPLQRVGQRAFVERAGERVARLQHRPPDGAGGDVAAIGAGPELRAAGAGDRRERAIDRPDHL